MLTLEKLKEMDSHTIFAYGADWVAVRGGIHDWAIYKGQGTKEYIRDWGNKVHSEEEIKLLVPCDKESFNMYRD